MPRTWFPLSPRQCITSHCWDTGYSSFLVPHHDAHPGGVDKCSLGHYIRGVSTSPESAAPEGRRRIIAEVDAGVAHSLRVFAAEHDTTISDVLRNLLENWLHFNSPSVLPTISVPDPPVVKGPSRLLCLKEVASYFQVSQETVRRWVRDRLIVAIRGGRRGGYLFDPADILKFRGKRSTGGRP